MQHQGVLTIAEYEILQRCIAEVPGRVVIIEATPQGPCFELLIESSDDNYLNDIELKILSHRRAHDILMRSLKKS